MQTHNELLASITDFQRGYLECLLWLTVPDEEQSSGEWSPTHPYTIENIDEDSLRKHLEKVTDFYNAQLELLNECEDTFSRSMEYLGHDFYLSRCGHGTGFWDRGMEEEGDQLHEAAKVYGDVYSYLGDDGKVYIS